MAERLAAFDPQARPRVEEFPGWVDPLAALEAARGERHPALLLSGLEGHPASRFSIVAWDPPLVASLGGHEARLDWAPWTGRDAARERFADPFDLLRALLPGPASPGPPGLPFAGGAIGYLGYGLRRAVERLPPLPPDPLGLPDAWFGLYDRAAIFDHRERRVVLVAAGLAPSVPDRRPDGAHRLAGLRARLGEAAGAAGRRGPTRMAGRRAATLATNPRDYRARIRRVLERIEAGDLYQANLSHRIDCPFDADPLDLFGALARRSPAPFAAYLDGGAFRIVSASPERFLALAGGRASSGPIKGTRPRGGTPAEDDRLARDLSMSPKDRAENVMIADLVRNDLGRVCRPGSVRVESLCALESFATVHHLVSTVAGRLRADRDRVDLLRALFPGGSMTGAPKVMAMEVIDALEGEERGVYAGSLGYLSLEGGMDLSIVIRTIVCVPGRASLRVGGGIVTDSDPDKEFRETLDKARALLEVLGAEIRA